MLQIAIVDDEEQAADSLRQMLERYDAEHRCAFTIHYYKNAIVFLTNYQPVFDLVFFDIQMPHMDGLEAARQLREKDSETMLVFVTNMANLAVKGYQVQAFEFLVKPLDYSLLSIKLGRMLEALTTRRRDKLIISSEGSQICLPSCEIYYVEVQNHRLIYHTASGDYPVYGSLAAAEKQLEGRGFSLCNNCYLVNLQHVQRVYKHTVTVMGTELPISHPRRKPFLNALNEYIGG